MKLITALIEDWALVGKAVYGNIYGDTKKRWKDGYPVKLSRLVPEKQELKTGAVISTNNSRYILGKEASK